MEKIEAVEGETIPNFDVKSYRDIILEFIKMDARVGRLQFNFRAEAKTFAFELRNWVRRDEKIKIRQQQYDVYLVKTDE